MAGKELRGKYNTCGLQGEKKGKNATPSRVELKHVPTLYDVGEKKIWTQT